MVINRLFYVLLAVFFFHGESITAQGKFTDLGPQVMAAAIQGSAFVNGTSGKQYVYTVVRGRPAHLLGFDVESKEKVADLELKGIDGSWDVEVASDGSLYVAGANGHLFRHVPGTHTLSDLGLVLPGEKVVWDLAAGKDGEVFGGTYPGCRVFRYHPSGGFSDIGRGPLAPGENYVRSLVYHSSSGKLYAGIGSHAHLVELDPKSGKKREMLDDKYRDRQYIYSLGLVEGLKGGDRLFAWLTGSSQRKTLIYNLKQGDIEREFSSFDVRSVIKADNSDQVFYTANSKLYRADFSLSDPNAEMLPGVEGTSLASAWSKDGELLILSSAGQLITFNASTRSVSTARLPIAEQPIDIQTIGIGPDGKVWTGGYLAGGHATYDPATNQIEQYKGLHQTEGMARQGDIVYFGIYPKAGIYAFNTRQAWDLKAGNPRHIASIKGQDRPFAVLNAGERMFFGTVPDYGKLGGALVEYDPKSGELKVFENIIKNQSIVSLAYSNRHLVGATSISGGLGIPPVEKEAKLFIWDPVSRKIVFEVSPVPGAMAITGLLRNSDGNIWGVADETLFVFDPLKRQVIAEKQLYPRKPRGTHSWRNAFLVLHSSGDVYGTVNGELFKINPSTLQYTKITDNASLLEMDMKGNFYFRRGTNLWRYDPDKY